jgi:hypothetical protein
MHDEELAYLIEARAVVVMQHPDVGAAEIGQHCVIVNAMISDSQHGFLPLPKTFEAEPA